ncbi:hypothetical protein G7Y89_g5869 [Cudoniella acicularis]|uniref:Uncharacterized protein n=1 Tax=Cudoniella acicularis TaxID=354080 RepID=A0A8H4RMF4_9HELO|nr:hypothetical protein G7Y89_g5869 [Cudoniella acicularis]
MSTYRYRNFRKILDVYPEWDKQCVAIKVNSEERCKIRGMAGRRNLDKAGEILNTMDRTSSLSECRGHLETLARLMMCGSPHRNMENVRADRVRRWNDTIDAYREAMRLVSIEQDEMNDVSAPESEEELETNNEELILEDLVDEETLHILPPIITQEISQPQEKSQESIVAQASRTVEPGTKTGDTLIDNEMEPSLESELQDDTVERRDIHTVHAPSDGATSEILISEQKDGPKSPENATKAYLATQRYGLPSPPDSQQAQRPAERHDIAQIRSPPETPTRAPVSTSNAQLDAPRPTASGSALKSTTDGTKWGFKFGSGESASSLQAFNFNLDTTDNGLKGSSNGNIKPNMPILSNFTTEFGPKENACPVIKFELPSEAPVTTEASSSSSQVEVQKDCDPNTESGASDPAPTSILDSASASKSPRYTAINDEVGKNPPTPVEPSSVSSSLLPLSATVDEGQTPAPTFEDLNSSKTPNALKLPHEKELIVPKYSSLSSSNPIPYVQKLNQKPLPTFSTASLLKTNAQDSLLLPNEEPLPVFTFGSSSNSLNAKLGPETSSPENRELLPAPVDNFNKFEFGTAPKSFDFDAQSKLWFAPRIAHKSSAIWSGFTLNSENDPDVKDDSERSKDSKTEALIWSVEKGKASTGESAVEKPAEPPEDDLAEGYDESESVSEPLQTPAKISARRFERLMTPEAAIGSQAPEILTPIALEGSVSYEQIKNENEEDLTFETTSYQSQTPEEDNQFLIERGIIAAKPSSEPFMMDENPVSTIEEDAATPEPTPELPNTDQNSISTVSDIASSELQSTSPSLHPDSEEDDTNPETRHEQPEQNKNDFPITIEEDTWVFPTTPEPKNGPLFTRTEFFGHALIDPTSRRISTRPQQNILATPQIVVTPETPSDEHAFSDVYIEPLTTPSPSLEFRSSEIPTGQQEMAAWDNGKEPSAVLEEEWRHGNKLHRDVLEWENDRGIPRKRRGRRLDKEVWKHVHQGIKAVSAAVRRRSGHVLKAVNQE